MTSAALIYDPPSKWGIVIAIAAAVAIHLCAAVLFAHRAPLPFDAPVATSPDIIGFDDSEPLPPAPDVEAPVPPPPSFSSEFFEEKSEPLIKRNAKPPVHPRGMPRSGSISNPRALALSAPRPEYPYEARSRHMTGSGVVALTVDSASGFVLDVSMEQSIGSPVLDQAALSAFRRWRFKSGTSPRVRVPITFTIVGAQF